MSKALIIGGGVIGLSTAYYLSKSGWEVSLIDRSDLRDNCSYGNLGMIVPSHFVPLASPGIVSQGIRWMFSRKSPFYVQPSLNPALLSWGIKFIRSANPAHVEYAAPFLKDLNVYSRELYQAIAKEPGFDFSLEQKGILMYYKTGQTGEEEVRLAEKAQKLGLDAVPLSPAGVRALEPGLEMDILGAVHYRCDAHLYPNDFVAQLVGKLKNMGVSFRTDEPVTGMVRNGRSVQEVRTKDGVYRADAYVLAGGASLPGLARMAGLRISLMPGKGYSFTLPHPERKLNVPAILCEARVAITPMAGRMRYGGTMEIAPLNRVVRMNRVEAIVDSVTRYFPGLRPPMPKAADVWYGFRPCSPDGLPYLGYAKGLDNVLVAGGHSMMGLSLGPASGKVIADLASHRKPEVAIDAFRADRFS